MLQTNNAMALSDEYFDNVVEDSVGYHKTCKRMLNDSGAKAADRDLTERYFTLLVSYGESKSSQSRSAIESFWNENGGRMLALFGFLPSPIDGGKKESFIASDRSSSAAS
jgi:hypothetical protein